MELLMCRKGKANLSVNMRNQLLDAEQIVAAFRDPNDLQKRNVSREIVTVVFVSREIVTVACASREIVTIVCLPRNRHNRVCLPRNRQRTHRCSVNVDILTEFEKRRSDSMCEGVNRATGHWKMTWTLLHKHLFLWERGSVIYWLCIIGSSQKCRA